MGSSTDPPTAAVSRNVSRAADVDTTQMAPAVSYGSYVNRQASQMNNMSHGASTSSYSTALRSDSVPSLAARTPVVLPVPPALGRSDSAFRGLNMHFQPHFSSVPSGPRL